MAGELYPWEVMDEEAYGDWAAQQFAEEARRRQQEEEEKRRQEEEERQRQLQMALDEQARQAQDQWTPPDAPSTPPADPFAAYRESASQSYGTLPGPTAPPQQVPPAPPLSDTMQTWEQTQQSFPGYQSGGDYWADPNSALGAFAGGIGQLGSGIGSAINAAAEWLPLDQGTEDAIQGFGTSLREEGERISKKYTPDEGLYQLQGNISDLSRAEFWRDHVVRNLPFTLGAIGVGLTGGAAAAGTAGLLGAGSTAVSLAGAAGSLGLPMVFEAWTEAGQTFEEAKARGYTDEQAADAASRAMQGNMLALITDPVQLASYGLGKKYLPKPLQDVIDGTVAKSPLKRTALEAVRIVGNSGSEGAQEVAQELVSQWALGDPLDLQQAGQSFLPGAAMGGAFGTAGSVRAGIQNLQDWRTTRQTPDSTEGEYPLDTGYGKQSTQLNPGQIVSRMQFGLASHGYEEGTAEFSAYTLGFIDRLYGRQPRQDAPDQYLEGYNEYETGPTLQPDPSVEQMYPNWLHLIANQPTPKQPDETPDPEQTGKNQPPDDDLEGYRREAEQIINFQPGTPEYDAAMRGYLAGRSGKEKDPSETSDQYQAGYFAGRDNAGLIDWENEGPTGPDPERFDPSPSGPGPQNPLASPDAILSALDEAGIPRHTFEADEFIGGWQDAVNAVRAASNASEWYYQGYWAARQKLSEQLAAEEELRASQMAEDGPQPDDNTEEPPSYDFRKTRRAAREKAGYEEGSRDGLLFEIGYFPGYNGMEPGRDSSTPYKQGYEAGKRDAERLAEWERQQKAERERQQKAEQEQKSAREEIEDWAARNVDQPEIAYDPGLQADLENRTLPPRQRDQLSRELKSDESETWGWLEVYDNVPPGPDVDGPPPRGFPYFRGGADRRITEAEAAAAISRGLEIPGTPGQVIVDLFGFYPHFTHVAQTREYTRAMMPALNDSFVSLAQAIGISPEAMPRFIGLSLGRDHSGVYTHVDGEPTITLNPWRLWRDTGRNPVEFSRNLVYAQLHELFHAQGAPEDAIPRLAFEFLSDPANAQAVNDVMQSLHSDLAPLYGEALIRRSLDIDTRSVVGRPERRNRLGPDEEARAAARDLGVPPDRASETLSGDSEQHLERFARYSTVERTAPIGERVSPADGAPDATGAGEEDLRRASEEVAGEGPTVRGTGRTVRELADAARERRGSDTLDESRARVNRKLANEARRQRFAQFQEKLDAQAQARERRHDRQAEARLRQEAAEGGGAGAPPPEGGEPTGPAVTPPPPERQPGEFYRNAWRWTARGALSTGAGFAVVGAVMNYGPDWAKSALTVIAEETSRALFATAGFADEFAEVSGEKGVDQALVLSVMDPSTRSRLMGAFLAGLTLEERKSSRDLLTRIGMGDGLAKDIAAYFADIVLDPLSWVSLGNRKALGSARVSAGPRIQFPLHRQWGVNIPGLDENPIFGMMGAFSRALDKVGATGWFTDRVARKFIAEYDLKRLNASDPERVARTGFDAAEEVRRLRHAPALLREEAVDMARQKFAGLTEAQRREFFRVIELGDAEALAGRAWYRHPDRALRPVLEWYITEYEPEMRNLKRELGFTDFIDNFIHHYFSKALFQSADQPQYASFRAGRGARPPASFRERHGAEGYSRDPILAVAEDHAQTMLYARTKGFARNLCETWGTPLEQYRAEVGEVNPKTHAIFKLEEARRADPNIPGDEAVAEKLYVLPMHAYQGLMSVIEVPRVFRSISAYDTALSAWKTMQLYLFPEYYTRNMLGDIMQNDLADVHPYAYVKAAGVMNANRTGDWTGAPSIRGVESTEEFYKTVRANLFGVGHHGGDIEGLVSERQRFEETNPIYRNTIGRIQSAGGSVTELQGNYTKMAHVISKVEEGASVDDAIKSAVYYLFDYSDITPFEEGLRRFIPFYTWYRKNVPLQIEALLTTPGKYSNLPRAGELVGRVGVTLGPLAESPVGITEDPALWVQDKLDKLSHLHGWSDEEWERSDMERRLQPHYLTDRFQVVVGKDQQGNYKVLSSIGIPAEDLNYLWRGSVQRTIDMQLASLNPAIAGIVAASTGHAYFSGLDVAEDASSNYYSRSNKAAYDLSELTKQFNAMAFNLPFLRDGLGIEMERSFDPKTGRTFVGYTTKYPELNYVVMALLGRIINTYGGAYQRATSDENNVPTERAGGVAEVAARFVADPVAGLTPGGQFTVNPRRSQLPYTNTMDRLRQERDRLLESRAQMFDQGLITGKQYRADRSRIMSDYVNRSQVERERIYNEQLALTPDLPARERLREELASPDEKLVNDYHKITMDMGETSEDYYNKTEAYRATLSPEQNARLDELLLLELDKYKDTAPTAYRAEQALRNARDAFQRYKEIPAYRGNFTPEEIRQIEEAQLVVDRERRQIPPEVESGMEIARRLAMQKRPDLARWIYYANTISRYRNPMRQQYWYANRNLLDTFYAE